MNLRHLDPEAPLSPLNQARPEFRETDCLVHEVWPRPDLLPRAAVEGMDDMSDVACGTCGGRCGTPQACMLPEQREAEARRLMRSAWKWLGLLSAAGLVLFLLGIGHA